MRYRNRHNSGMRKGNGVHFYYWKCIIVKWIPFTFIITLFCLFQISRTKIAKVAYFRYLKRTLSWMLNWHHTVLTKSKCPLRDRPRISPKWSKTFWHTAVSIYLYMTNILVVHNLASNNTLLLDYAWQVYWSYIDIAPPCVKLLVV